MDDDTTTRDNLQADVGPKSAGHLEECLAGIVFLSDLSHQKCTAQNHYFGLVGGVRKRAGCYKRSK